MPGFGSFLKVINHISALSIEPPHITMELDFFFSFHTQVFHSAISPKRRGFGFLHFPRQLSLACASEKPPVSRRANTPPIKPKALSLNHSSHLATERFHTIMLREGYKSLILDTVCYLISLVFPIISAKRLHARNTCYHTSLIGVR